MTTIEPITAAQVPDSWVLACREAIYQREGVPIRKHATLPRIEAFSHANGWSKIMLSNSGFDFATTEDRDAVFEKLTTK